MRDQCWRCAEAISIAIGWPRSRGCLRRPAFRHHGPSAGNAAQQSGRIAAAATATAVGKRDGRGYLHLGDVATLEIAPGPNQISREDGKRRVGGNGQCAGRDIGSLSEAETLSPERDRSNWLLDQLGRHIRTTAIRHPAAANCGAGRVVAGILLLFAMFSNVKDGLLVFTGIPFALTGGVLACGCAIFRCRFRPRSALSPCPA